MPGEASAGAALSRNASLSDAGSASASSRIRFTFGQSFLSTVARSAQHSFVITRAREPRGAFQSAREFVFQPSLCGDPVAFDGCRGDIQHFGRFVDLEPREITELDDPHLLLVQLRQTFECLVQCYEIDIEGSRGELR